MNHFIKAKIKKIVPEFLKKRFRKYNRNKYLESIIGANVFCPICKSNFKFFGIGGMDNRQNARCHKCDSLERHRLCFLFIEEKLNILNSSQPIRLLHFAPEKCLYQVFSSLEHVEYIPCDLNPELYNYGGSSEIIKVDMTNIPYKEDTFDFILQNQVLEHIPNDGLALDELYRVMKRGGSGIFQVPIDYSREVTYEDFTIVTPEERKLAFGQHDHMRWYGRDYKDRIAKHGFKVIEDRFVYNLSKADITKYGLTENELIYYCLKE